MEPAPLQKVEEWRDVDLRTLREEIIPRDQPALLKGFVAQWPIVRVAAQSPEALLDYVRARDPGQPLQIMVGRPEIKGVYFYRDDLSGLNFEYRQQPLHAALASILASRNLPDPPAIYSGARAVERYFPQIGRENNLSQLPATGKSAWSYVWLGNAVTAATHYDNMEGINCVNFSINFWWCEPADFAAEPFGALVHSLLALRQLSPERRETWRMMFDHYVFQTSGDPVPHLPPDRRGMLGPLSPQQTLYLKKQLMRSLVKQMPRELSVKILQALFADPAG
jgi:hypothetical protein